MTGRLRASLVAAGVTLVVAGCGGGAADPAAAPVETRSSAAPAPPPAVDPGDRAAAVPAAAGSAVPVPAGSRPVRISVPRIGIDASLIDLGITRDGVLEVPADFAQAGWADRSAVPGERGPAVIAGHVDSKTGPAVFYRLRDLRPGDAVVITREDGTRVTFHVDGSARYAKSGFPTAAVYGPVPGPVLRLITCGGVFDRRSGHYRDNVVVFAS